MPTYARILENLRHKCADLVVVPEQILQSLFEAQDHAFQLASSPRRTNVLLSPHSWRSKCAQSCNRQGSIMSLQRRKSDLNSDQSLDCWRTVKGGIACLLGPIESEVG